MPEVNQAKDDTQLRRMRLFVGGLHEDVTMPDLQQRFGKFGSVSSVDIRFKRDTHGKVANVFAHMDIDITQANFKKCVSTYNNAKWKGHAMRVQVAKDSFLTKLEAERKERLENKDEEKPAVRMTKKMKEQEEAMAQLEENMNKAGVENFILKKAVPGTPIPGEDSWIVGKFGRVLPIMHMRRKDNRSHMTYDPSKYGHYLRKFKENAQNDQLMSESSVTELTWHLPEEKSAMDCKRMGEFHDYVQKKRSKTQLQQPKTNGKSQPQLFQTQTGRPTSPVDDFEVVKVNRKDNKMDLVKLRPITAKETEREANIAQLQEKQLEDPGEVGEVLAQCRLESDNESCGSADTDEICNFSRKQEGAGKQVLSNWADDYYHKERVSLILSDAEYNIPQRKYLEAKEEKPDPGIGVAVADISFSKMNEGVASYGQRTSGDTDAILKDYLNEDDDNGEDKERNSESDATGEDVDEGDSEQYESNAKDEGNIDKYSLEEGEDYENDTSDEEDEEEESNFEEDIEITEKFREDRLGEVDEVEDTDEDDDEDKDEIDAEENIKNTKKIKRDDVEKTDEDDEEEDDSDAGADIEDTKKIKRDDPGGDDEVEDPDEDNGAEEDISDADEDIKDAKKIKEDHLEGDDWIEDSDEDDDEDDESDANEDIEIKENGDDQDQDDDSDEEKPSNDVIREDFENNHHDGKTSSFKDNIRVLNKNLKENSRSTDEDEGDESDESDDGSDSDDSSDSSDTAGKTNKPSSVDSRDKRKLSDKIRLDSVKKRQAAVLHQKTAIQEALKAVDSSRDASSGRHVRFDSDDEAETVTDVKSGAAVKMENTKLPGLFDSDDEEGMEIDEEADEDRFKIKPQFHGKAGEKLLKLQDRFGTDSRFKMGENFMEEGEEDSGEMDEDEEEEKQRSLAVLEGIVGSRAMNSLKHKTTSNFRDPSQMRYDPSRDDHAQFEIRKEEPVTQKRTLAKDEAIPDVGREKYFEVAKLDIGKDAGDSQPFSFFGDTEIEKDEEDATGLGSLQQDILASTKLSKKQLALDSSDEESDEEEMKQEEEEEEKKSTEGDTPSGPPKPVNKAFFFLDDDVRLKTGPQLFCRTLSNEALNKWFEQQKADLQGEYKKRHQKAVRDSKAAQQRSRNSGQKRPSKASR